MSPSGSDSIIASSLESTLPSPLMSAHAVDVNDSNTSPNALFIHKYVDAGESGDDNAI